jgi:hypothetical protein
MYLNVTFISFSCVVIQGAPKRAFLRFFKFFYFHQNNPIEGFSMRGIGCALLKLENTSLTLIQGRDLCIEAKIG